MSANNWYLFGTLIYAQDQRPVDEETPVSNIALNPKIPFGLVRLKQVCELGLKNRFLKAGYYKLIIDSESIQTHLHMMQTDSNQIRIALVEDNAVNRATFQQKIQQHSDLQLIFVANDGNECMSQLKGMPLHLLPRVIFMDIEMPVLNGIETIALAKSIYPEIHFIILTIFDDDEKIFDAIRAGASGYLLKHETHTTIEEAIINVLEYGGAPMSPAIARKALYLLNKTGEFSGADKTNAIPQIITEREKEILQHTVSGWDAKQIAAHLNLSVLTVRKHIANIYEKLHVQSKAQIIRMAQKNHWYRF